MKPHTVLHIRLEYGDTKRNTRVSFFLRQTLDYINYKNGHPKSVFVGSNHKNLGQSVECQQ